MQFVVSYTARLCQCLYMNIILSFKTEIAQNFTVMFEKVTKKFLGPDVLEKC